MKTEQLLPACQEQLNLCLKEENDFQVFRMQYT